MVADVSQDAGFDILSSVPGVDDFARERIEQNGIDGKIASRTSFSVGEVWNSIDEKATMPGCRFALETWEGHIDIVAAEFDDAKAHADGIEIETRGEQCQKIFRRETVHFDIKIFRRLTAKSVPHATADKKRRATSLTNKLGDGQGGFGCSA